MMSLPSRSEPYATGLTPPVAPRSQLTQKTHDPASLFIVIAFSFYVAVSLYGIAGRLLSLTFPVGCVLIALLCYARSPATYLGFTFWLWLLTPFMRRVYDLHYGFHPTSPLLLAPLLASLVSLITVLRRRQMLRSASNIPFMIAGAALAYAFLIGVIRQAAVPAAYDLLTWLAPLLFGMHIALEWRNFPNARATLTTCTLFGLIVTSLYGVAQFVNPPMWDRAWVINAEMTSIGAPLPFIIRVYSTLNAPGPFSIMLVFSLLIGLAAPQRWRIIALAIGLVALILTKGRSAWGAFLIGGMVMQIRQPLKSLPRQWLALFGVIILAVPLITQPRVLSTLAGRAATLRNVENDDSFRTRVNFTQIALYHLSTNPAGSGLGGLGGAAKLLSGTKMGVALDSGPLEIYAIMGWLGGTLYMLSLLAVVLPIIRTRRERFEPVTNAAVSVVVALLLTALFGNIFNSVSGFFFWTAVGLAAAGRTYSTASDVLMRYAKYDALHAARAARTAA